MEEKKTGGGGNTSRRKKDEGLQWCEECSVGGRINARSGTKTSSVRGRMDVEGSSRLQEKEKGRKGKKEGGGGGGAKPVW